MTTTKIIILSVLIIAFMTASSEASWLIYHKPEFKGRVIDAETKEPIEGAVVVVVFNKENFGYPAGGYTTVVKAKETLTDKNGEFDFPAYTTIIQPLSAESFAQFIIYKPGYGSFPGQGTIPSGLGLDSIETFFSKETGFTGELEGLVNTKMAMIKVTCGIVELPELKTREERLRAIPDTPTEIRSKGLPLLYKAINEERRTLGLKGEVK